MANYQSLYGDLLCKYLHPAFDPLIITFWHSYHLLVLIETRWGEPLDTIVWCGL